MEKGDGWALDTGQVEEEIQNKYFATTTDNTVRKITI